MGLRVAVEDGEEIGQALRRLNQLMKHARLHQRIREREWRLTEPGEFRRWQAERANRAARAAAYRRSTCATSRS